MRYGEFTSDDEELHPKNIEKAIINAFTGEGWSYTGTLPKLYFDHSDGTYASTDSNYNTMYKWVADDEAGVESEHFYLAIGAYVANGEGGIVISDAYAGKWKGKGIFKRLIGDLTVELKNKDHSLRSSNISLVIKGDATTGAWRSIADYHGIEYVNDPF